jgi:8-oxo-dGTP pyrophosphatase MutT (NUDIX family)
MLPRKSYSNSPQNYKGYYTKKKYKDNIESFGLIPFYVNYSKEKGCTLFREAKDTVDSVSERTFTNNLCGAGTICDGLEQNGTVPYTIEYLVQQRRDTFEYDEQLQGMWQSLDRCKILFSFMTIEELERYSSHVFDFDKLWDDLWIDKTTRMYKEGYVRAKKKHEEIQHNLLSYINASTSTLTSTPWGFPKGRKISYSESDQECAIRESEEECRVPRDLYRVLPFKYSEKFLGSNGVSYSTTYFLCEVKERYIPPRIDTTQGCIRTSSISEEVNDVKWLTYDDACEILNSQRKSILCEANDAVKKYVSSKKS